MRLRRRAATPQDVQILERRQVLHIALHPQALRTNTCTTPSKYRLTGAVEWLRGAAAAVARAKPRHIIRLLLHTRERHITRAVHTRSGRTSEQAHGRILVEEADGTQAPSWVYYSFAFGMWMYSTMDNVDGKQARRTGTSSPLGELFEYVT
jgi:phosphatidylglycerophosphate synthase